jgi:hypothetical protein
MAWPTPQDYNEAVQNPNLVFADPELRTGHAELDRLGLPRPRSGGFASVYRMQCGQRDWAVRCFLREFYDQQQRYAAISDHLARVRLPYTVGFTFLRQGIRVRGQWYPILKMEWVQGEPLNVYIEKRLASPDTLLSLASRWVQLVKALQQASVAHGDLQHGNVFVVEGDLRLIDYDGMYVPALSGQASHEVGHRNYQHPLRTESDFGPYLDNFSAWVIYVSLIALTVDPRLWQRFGCGDESLLFRRKDFERPEGSDALHALEMFPDERIRSAATLFKSLLYLGPQHVPSLDGQIAPPAHTIITCESCGQSLRVPADRGPGRIRCPKCGWQKDWAPHRSNVPDWVKDHLGHELSQTGEPALDEHGNHTQLITEPDPTWIIDFLQPPGKTIQPVSFARSAAVERFFIGLSAIGSLLLILATQAGTVGTSATGPAILLAALVNLVLWVYRYRSEPGVADFIDLKSILRAISKQIRATTHDIEAAGREKRNHRDRDASERAGIAKDQKTVETKETKEIDASQRALQSVLSSINTRRRALNQQEADALRKIQNDIGAKVAALSRQISALTQAEATDLANTLRAQQEQHITVHLRRFTLDDASVSGVGSIFKSRLKIAGFQTAADIDVYRVQSVKGIGSSRAASLAAWRRSIESRARASMPQALSQSNAAAIRAKYQSQQLALEDERGREQRRQRDEENAVRAQCRRSLEPLDTEESAANTKTKGEVDEIRARHAQQYRSFREALSKLAEETASKLREIDARIGEARKELFSLHWEKEKLRRELKAFEGIRFPKYVKRLFFGSRAA